MATIPRTGSRLPHRAPGTRRNLGARRSPFDGSLLRDLDPWLIGATTNGNGTAYAAFRGIGGPTVAGKTGTAQSNGKQDTSLFVGISPPDQPQYVVAAVVEEGGFGASVAAPVVARVFEGINGDANAAAVQVRPPDIQD